MRLQLWCEALYSPLTFLRIAHCPTVHSKNPKNPELSPRCSNHPPSRVSDCSLWSPGLPL